MGKIIEKSGNLLYEGYIYCEYGCFNPIVDAETGSKFEFNIIFVKLATIERPY